MKAAVVPGAKQTWVVKDVDQPKPGHKGDVRFRAVLLT
jgi:hypothetical protein